MTPAQKRASTIARNKTSADRISIAQAATRAVVAAGKCPECGRAVKRNLSISGWWQCSQFGSEQFRADPTQPPCSWQGFTE